MSDVETEAALQARHIAHAAVTCYMTDDRSELWNLLNELVRTPRTAGYGILALLDAVNVLVRTLAEEFSLSPIELWSETLRQDALREVGGDAPE